MRLFALLSLLVAQAGPAPQFTSSLPPVPPPMEAMPPNAMQPAPQRMETDDSPTERACTFARAIRGDHCTFEGESGAGNVRDNSAAVYRAGAFACAAAALKDEALRAQCDHEVSDLSLKLPCASPGRLADPQGNLTAEAAECVEQVRAAVARVSRINALSKSCCACLAESRCTVPVKECRNELADFSPRPALRSCISHACPAECSVFTPSQPETARTMDPMPPPQASDNTFKP